MIHLKNEADTQDIFQTVFLKYLLYEKPFESQEHEKAWFIRVTINACKDLLKSFFRSHTVSLEELTTQAADLSDDRREVLSAVLELPRRQRQAVYLHYYERYTAPEIGRLMGRNVNTIYTDLARARKRLRERLGGKTMDEQIRDAFASIHAEAELKESTRSILEQAHHVGLSLGKYEAFLELQTLDPTVTTDDVAGLTMRQIRDWIASLESGGTTAGESQTGHGYHHGWHE